MSIQPATLYSGDEALAKFRQSLTGPYAFDLLATSGGRLLIQLPVGIGKSEWMIRIIDHALNTACEHDLVVVLVPRWDVLNELKARLPATVTPVVLQPRPRKRCGPLDAAWVKYEQTGCGLLGREELCGHCPRRKKCPWPDQYGDKLNGVKLILATQHHLVLNPQFIDQLRQATGAERVLLLLDESDLLLKPADKLITVTDLERFIAAQEAVLSATASPMPAMKNWLELSQLLPLTRTEDLQEGQWRFSPFDGSWAVAVQSEGRQKYGNDFRFLGYDLRHFRRSDILSREKLPNGDIRFAVLPDLGNEFIIFSGSMARELARYRLDPNHRRPTLLSPFERHEFRHPQTKWYNIGSFEGAASLFPKNAERILDFFAAKIAANIQAGKRTLLICRKRFRDFCSAELTRRLQELGYHDVRIVTKGWDRLTLDNPRLLPLITYGICGVNRFEHFDAAHCLTGYYINDSILIRTVYDIDATTDRFPITIRSEGTPRRRIAHVELPDQREPITPLIAQEVLVQKEADVVLQAVGRVRPFTRPREIITFQADILPGVTYSFAFPSIAGIRSYFQIPTRGELKRQNLATRIAELRQQGRTQEEAGSQLGICARTVKRYEQAARGHVPSSPGSQRVPLTQLNEGDIFTSLN
jgi:hypothetical protein